MLPNPRKQRDHLSKSQYRLALVVITRNRPESMKRLAESILKAKLEPFYLVLIDDSDPGSFRKTKDFLSASSVQFRQLTSSQAGKLVQETLREVSLTERERRFIRTCTGLHSPFSGFVERFSEFGVEGGLMSRGLSFAPYSAARNLGIYCAVRFFAPDAIFFLDDDCEILHPEQLKDQIMLLHTTLGRKSVLASSGVYKDFGQLPSEPNFPEKVLQILRGMDAFLQKAFARGNIRFEIMPPHILGGVLMLHKRVFSTLPFDPYVARGEDHAYALDLKQLLGEDEIYVRDNHFTIGHRKAVLDRAKANLNTLRDTFRFVYVRRKTGRNFIPCFGVRWALASLTSVFLNLKNHKRCRNELVALLFIAPRFARRNAHKFGRGLPAWNSFLRQLNQED
jgi:glycosyltransferase involved in cell wall biosynthesis